jgi:hypothetical protein
MSNVNADECIAAGCALHDSFDITQRLPVAIEGTFGDKKETIFEEATILPSDERAIKGKGQGVINCGIEAQINDKSPRLKLNESGVLMFSDDTDAKLIVKGYLTDEEIQQCIDTENHLSDRDKNAIEIENKKNELEGNLLSIERLVRDDKEKVELIEQVFPDFIKTVELTREWFDEHEFDTMNIEEYNEKNDAIRRALELVDIIEESSKNIQLIKERANKVLNNAINDKPRFDDGEKESLINDAKEFIDSLSTVSPTSKLEKENEMIETLESRYKELIRMPLKNKARKNQQQKASTKNFWPEIKKIEKEEKKPKRQITERDMIDNFWDF